MEKNMGNPIKNYSFLEMIKPLFYIEGFMEILSCISLIITYLNSGNLNKLLLPFIYQLFKRGLYLLYCVYGIKAINLKSSSMFKYMTIFSGGMFLYRFIVILKFAEDKVFNIPVMFIFLTFVFYKNYLKSIEID